MNNVNRSSSGTRKAKQYKRSIVFDPIQTLLQNKFSADQELHTERQNGLRTTYPGTRWIQMAGRFGRAVMGHQLPNLAVYRKTVVVENRMNIDLNGYTPETVGKHQETRS